MLHFFFFLFIIIIAVLFIGLSIIGAILRGLFGLGRRKSAPFKEHSSEEKWQNHSSDPGEDVRPEEGELHINRKKLFTKEDGEYVDFEEIKE